MANQSSGNPKKPNHSKIARTAPQKAKQHVKKSKQLGISSQRQKTRRNPRNQNREIEQKITYCVIGYTISFFTASVLWSLQIPSQVVYALLIISTLLILLYLIPLRERYTEFVNRSLLLVIITFLITVLSFNREEVLQMLTHLFQ